MKVSPRDILFIFFSKLHVMIGVFFIVTTVVVVKTLKTPPVYEVSAAVLIRPLLDSRLELQTNRFTVSPVTQEDVNTEIKLIVSKRIMKVAAEKLGLIEKQRNVKPKEGMMVKLGIEYEASPDDKAINYIRSDLDISAVTMSNMIQITKRGSEPAEITKIVNTILDCYIDLHIEAHKPAGSVEFYNHEASSYEKKILTLEEDLNKYQKQYFFIDYEQQNISYIKMIETLNDSLTQLRARIDEQRIKITLLYGNFIEKGEVTIMAKEYRDNQMLIELAKVYVPLLAEKERVSVLYPKSSVEYQNIGRQAERFRTKIIEEQRSILSGMEMDLNALIKSETVLVSELNRIKAEAELLKEKEINRKRLIEKIQQYKSSYKLYVDKLEETRITEEREKARAANVFVSSWASEPSKPILPNVKARMMLAIPAGAIAGIFAVLIAFYLDHTVKNPEDMERFSGFPTLSSIGIINPLIQK